MCAIQGLLRSFAKYCRSFVVASLHILVLAMLSAFSFAQHQLAPSSAFPQMTAALFHPAKFTASDAETNDQFGRSVAVDRDSVLIGSRNAEAAYVFIRSGNVWRQQAILTPIPADAVDGQLFGFSVAIRNDTAVVGALFNTIGGPASGAAFVFSRLGEAWVQVAKISPSDGAPNEHFGTSVAISDDVIVVGAPLDDENGLRSGSAYVFVRPPGGWANTTETMKLTSSSGTSFDRFGNSVAIDNDTVLVGASMANTVRPGAAYVFDMPAQGWGACQQPCTETFILTPNDGSNNDRFGAHGDIDDDTVVIGARFNDDNGSNSGAVYVFVRSNDTWVLQEKLTASDAAAGDEFGISVGVADDIIVAGAWNDDDNGANSGSAYAFSWSGTHWLETTKLLRRDNDYPGDAFGIAVAISGETAVAGAPEDDDACLGDLASADCRSGSAYVYDLSAISALDERSNGHGY